MESSLHRSLKDIYAPPGSRTEAPVAGYRADVLHGDQIVEVQTSPLGALVPKLSVLLEHRRVLVVKPIAERKYLVRRSSRSGPDLGRRASPKRGHLLDAFDELVHFTRVFPHPHLTLELLLISEEEVRVERKRRSARRAGFFVADRRLVSIGRRYRLRTAQDLLALLPGDIVYPFTTATLSRQLRLDEWSARKIAYTLRHCGALRVQGKIGNRLVYEAIPSTAAA